MEEKVTLTSSLRDWAETILENLSETETKFVSVLQRVETGGKFLRAVPVLLSHAMISDIDKLLSLRRLVVH